MLVIYGTFTREFICLPRFATPPGFMIVAIYPKAAEDRMSKVEQLYKIREGLLSSVRESERTDEA